MTDVCLVLEGSYPTVRGGVAEWVDGLVRGLSDIHFSVVQLRDEADQPGPPVYAPPANVVSLIEAPVTAGIPAAEPPAALAYHALSTGLAGSVTARWAAERGRPFLLTEHGLAWREARLGIAGCKPHVTGCKPHRVLEPAKGEHPREARERWARSVELAAREAYRHADAVTTVCRANAVSQAMLGARPRVIPNGVLVPPARPPAEREPLVGFVGRVVAIKDVETLLRAFRAVADEDERVRFGVVGPLDHEPEYAAACLELADGLGLSDRVEFAGETDPAPWYERMDVLVLTSLSEAAPLVALEAMTAGIPVVATAVGGCPELIAGAGLVTPVRDPAATAAAILRLLADEVLRRRLGRRGRERVERRHRRERMLAAYRTLYERAA